MTSSTCSASSHAADEQLFATAPRADYWFLLEHNRPYGVKALAESGLPPDVKDKLESAAAALPNGRVQLIKRGSIAEARRVKFFVAVNHEEQPNLYEFELDRVEDLIDLDLGAIAAEDKAYRSHDRTDPLFLVCTNGKRDPCCASLGLPLYRAMHREYGEAVWEAAHVGGHRFSPLVVALPSGAYYGYVGPESAGEIVAASRDARVHLPHFRGRSCYAAHVQAADIFLRRHTRSDGLLQFKLIESRSIAENAWMLHFQDRFSGQTCCIQVRSVPSAVTVRKSCSDPAPTALSQFVVEDVVVYG